MSMGFPEFPVVLVICSMALVVIWSAACVARRLGYTPLLGILTVIPIVNVLFRWFVTYAEWPIASDKVGA